MNLLGLYPDSIVSRVRSAKAPVHIPSLIESLAVAAGGLAILGGAVAVGLSLGGERVEEKLGVMGADAFRAGTFILLGGAILSRLVIGPGRVLRFYVLFAVALFLQAAAWTLIYFPLRSEAGKWLGLAFGSLVLGLTMATAFDATRQAFRAIVVLFVTRSAGFFGAEWLRGALPGQAGGYVASIVIALGLGAGLGYALYACQETVRQRLKAAPAPIQTASAPS